MNESFKPTDNETAPVENTESLSDGEQKLLEELRVIKSVKMREEVPDEEINARYDKIVAFGEELLREIPRETLSKFRLWHVLIGSTVSPKDAPELDLPDGRIERFIREEL